MAPTSTSGDGSRVDANYGFAQKSPSMCDVGRGACVTVDARNKKQSG